MLKKALFVILIPFLFAEIFLKFYPLLGTDFLGFGWLRIYLVLNDSVTKNLASEMFSFLREDGELGYVLSPGGRVRAYSGEYNITYEIEDAFSDGDIGINDEPVRADTFAFAFGDSFTFCWGVKKDDCWVEVLERKIKKEISNFGVFGYGFFQKFGMFLRVLHKAEKKGIKPAVIFFQLLGQDIADDLCFSARKFCHPVHPLLIFEGGRSISSVFLIADFILKKRWKEGTFRYVILNARKSEIERILLSYKKIARKVEDYCKKRGCRVIWISDEDFPVSLPPPIVHIPSGDMYYFRSEKHLNPLGHRKLAEDIVKKLGEVSGDVE